MINVKIEDGRPINLHSHKCNCKGKCVICKCKESVKEIEIGRNIEKEEVR